MDFQPKGMKEGTTLDQKESMIINIRRKREVRQLYIKNTRGPKGKGTKLPPRDIHCIPNTVHTKFLLRSRQHHREEN